MENKLDNRRDRVLNGVEGVILNLFFSKNVRKFFDPFILCFNLF